MGVSMVYMCVCVLCDIDHTAGQPTSLAPRSGCFTLPIKKIRYGTSWVTCPLTLQVLSARRRSSVPTCHPQPESSRGQGRSCLCQGATHMYMHTHTLRGCSFLQWVAPSSEEFGAHHIYQSQLGQCLLSAKHVAPLAAGDETSVS